MKRLTATILFLYCLTNTFGQNTNIRLMVDSLQYLITDTLDCKADLYWRIISKGDKAIPFFINKLTDTTQTQIKFQCKKARLNVGDVAYLALTQIANFPISLITKRQNDVIIIGEGCGDYYDFIFINSNKIRFQKEVTAWYEKEKAKYKIENISKTEQTECQRQYGINTFYRWTK